MSRKFGWCMENSEEHDNCRVLYRDWNNVVQECACACHDGKQKPEPPAEVQGATPNDGKSRKRVSRK